MLLASSITPSGYPWALDSIERSIPGIAWLGAIDSGSDSADGLAGIVQVSGASTVSPDLLAGLTSIRAVRALASVIARGCDRGDAVAAWFPGSVVQAVTDLQALTTLLDISGVVAPGNVDVEHMWAASAAIDRGDVELLLVSPPEESAVASLTSEVATAVAAGLLVRGVAICPMPRKSDGWPASIRQTARSQVDALATVLHPIKVDRARGRAAPAFPQSGVDVCQEKIDRRSDGTWVWSISIPGLSTCDVAIGTWSADITYPTTHVVISVDGRTIRRRVDSIVRRCVAADAVVSGDSIAMTFRPHEDQWPTQSQAGVDDE